MPEKLEAVATFIHEKLEAKLWLLHLSMSEVVDPL